MAISQATHINYWVGWYLCDAWGYSHPKYSLESYNVSGKAVCRSQEEAKCRVRQPRVALCSFTAARAH